MTSKEEALLLITSAAQEGNEVKPISVAVVPSDDDNTDSAPSDNEGAAKPTEKHTTEHTSLEKRGKKKTIIILCSILWFIIAVVLIVFFVTKAPGTRPLTTGTPTTDVPTTHTPVTPSVTSKPLREGTSTSTTTYIPDTSTSEAITMILYEGNTVNEKGIVMTFPPKAFPDSELIVTISDASESIKSLFSDTTSAFQTMSIENITNNVIHFEVEHMPLSTPNITYKTIIPIPSDLLQQCPKDYGYEIFTKMKQEEFPLNTYWAFVLFESRYDSTQQTLTTHLFPEMFDNYAADIVLSCTPGANVPVAHVRRRSLLQNYALDDCRASEIICPIEGGRCITLNAFDRDHAAVDYVTEHKPIVAAHNGVVERNEVSITYGQLIVIRGEDGSATLYSNLGAVTVDSGQEVDRGDVIALPKTSAPPHLHFEYIPNGRIYATKKRINPSDCFPPMTTETPVTQTNDTTEENDTTTTTTTAPLPEGSITLRDSGRLADDSFAGYIDGYKVCETTIGALNTCAINFLRPGLHTLTVEVLVAADGWGTFNVKLSDGWMFTDDTTTRDQIDDIYKPDKIIKCPPGWKGSWNFTVPLVP